MRVHIFVDAENINPQLFVKSYSYLRKRYDIIRIDIFSKEDTLPKLYKCYGDCKKIQYIKCFFNKNSADTFMTAYSIKALYEEPLTGGFVFITQDKDFSPAIKVITEQRKQAIIVTERDMSIKSLREIGTDMKYVTNVELTLNHKRSDEDVKSFKIPDIHQTCCTKYDMSQTIFIRDGKGQLIEVSFCNNMGYNDFCSIIPKQRIKLGYPAQMKLEGILKLSFLKVENDKIFIDISRIIEEE